MKPSLHENMLISYLFIEIIDVILNAKSQGGRLIYCDTTTKHAICIGCLPPFCISSTTDAYATDATGLTLLHQFWNRCKKVLFASVVTNNWCKISWLVAWTQPPCCIGCNENRCNKGTCCIGCCWKPMQTNPSIIDYNKQLLHEYYNHSKLNLMANT